MTITTNIYNREENPKNSYFQATINKRKRNKFEGFISYRKRKDRAEALEKLPKHIRPYGKIFAVCDNYNREKE